MSAEPIRTPCLFRVESERPWITTPPRSVTVHQSPCRQTPGKTSKYASWYFTPVGSFQNETGMDGNGAVRTSSPTSPTRGCPAASHDSTRHPSARHWISPE